MALTYERYRILDELEVLREKASYPQINKDAFVEQLYSQSPIDFDLILVTWEEEENELKARTTRINAQTTESKPSKP